MSKLKYLKHHVKYSEAHFKYPELHLSTLNYTLSALLVHDTLLSIVQMARFCTITTLERYLHNNKHLIETILDEHLDKGD